MTLFGFYYTSMSIISGLTYYNELSPEFDDEIKRVVKDALNEPDAKEALDLTDTGVNRIANLACLGSKVAISTAVGVAWPAYSIYCMTKEARELWKAVHD